MRDFRDLRLLTTLDLNKNQISSIERNTFKTLVSLSSIDLANNNLFRIDSDLLTHAYNLNYFRMAGNLVNSLRENTFRNLSQITLLDLNRNGLFSLGISDHPSLFEKMTILEKLDLSENKLAEISNTLFDAQVSLEWLYLNYSEISIVKKKGSFRSLKKLICLDLSFNKIKFLDLDQFKGAFFSLRIDLSSNKHLESVTSSLRSLRIDHLNLANTTRELINQIDLTTMDLEYLDLSEIPSLDPVEVLGKIGSNITDKIWGLRLKKKPASQVLFHYSWTDFQV
jgi:Leucine-rich repeat (LRR) protein